MLSYSIADQEKDPQSRILIRWSFKTKKKVSRTMILSGTIVRVRDNGMLEVAIDGRCNKQLASPALCQSLGDRVTIQNGKRLSILRIDGQSFVVETSLFHENDCSVFNKAELQEIKEIESLIRSQDERVIVLTENLLAYGLIDAPVGDQKSWSQGSLWAIHYCFKKMLNGWTLKDCIEDLYEED